MCSVELTTISSVSGKINFEMRVPAPLIQFKIELDHSGLLILVAIVAEINRSSS